MTVNVPPSYARNINEWIDANAHIGEYTYEVDLEARAVWDSVYERLREELWNSEEVTDLQRRSLWSAELRQAVDARRNLYERKRVDFNVDAFLEEVLAFCRRFPRPIDGRGEAYLWDIGSVLYMALGRFDTLALSGDERIAFARQLSELESQAAVFFGTDITANNGDYTFHSLHRYHKRAEETSGELVDDTVRSSPSISLASIAYALPFYPGVHQPQSRGSRAAFYADTYLYGIRFLHMGDQYWGKMTDQDRVQWLRMSGAYSGRPLFYPESFSRYLWVSGQEREKAWLFDRKAADHWHSTAVRRGQQLVQSAEISVNERIVVETFLSYREFSYARTLWKYANDNSISLRYLNRVKVLGTLLRTSPANTELAEVVAAGLSRVERYQSELGLSDEQRRDFFLEFQGLDAPEVARTLAAVLGSRTLVRGDAVSIEAKSLVGEPFDTRSLAGQVVLIDHWDTNCGPCIAAMPGLHDVYQRYKERGVEVVSIAYDGTSQRARVDRIKEENGLTWITLDGEGLWPAISAQYRYRGVPQYMLLDREGRWYAGTEEMGNGDNFEALLNEILAVEETEKEAATIH